MASARVDRERCRRSLHAFVRAAWHLVEPTQPFVDNWHIGLVCEHLEALSTLQIKNLLINVPPGTSKSTLVSVFWPVWHWLRHDPGARILRVAYDGGLTIRDSGKALDLMQHTWFTERWGDVFTVDKTVARGDYYNDHKGWAYAASLAGSITGKHFDFHVIDDPHKPKDVTPIGLKTTLDLLTGTLPSRRRNVAKFGQVLVMQRLHEGDASAVLPATGTWEKLILPMRFEPERRAVTTVGRDPRTHEGELLFPARFPDPELAELEKSMGAQAAATQMQQRPSPDAGLIFKREWIRYYDDAPVFSRMIQSWDMSFKAGAGSDNVAGQVWGVHGTSFYLVDQVLCKMTFTESLDAVRAMSKKWPKAHTKLIEDKANGSAIVDVLNKELRGIVAVNPSGGKVARANAVTQLFEAGNVYLPRNVLWVEGYVLSLIGFPTARHDDDVDATTQALGYLQNKNAAVTAAMVALAKKGGSIGV